MKTTRVLPLLCLLCAPLGCDEPIEETATFAEDAEHRAKPIPLTQPWHGRWEGNITNTANWDYDATIVANGPLCPFVGFPNTAEWDYYTLPELCTSNLTYLGTSIDANGTKTYTFADTTQTGPCLDGLVDLEETEDPDIMNYTWRELKNGAVHAQGVVKRNGTCSPAF